MEYTKQIEKYTLPNEGVNNSGISSNNEISPEQFKNFLYRVNEILWNGDKF